MAAPRPGRRAPAGVIYPLVALAFSLTFGFSCVWFAEEPAVGAMHGTGGSRAVPAAYIGIFSLCCALSFLWASLRVSGRRGWVVWMLDGISLLVLLGSAGILLLGGLPGSG